MHDDGHPFRLESREYPDLVEVMKNGPWYDGTEIETAREKIYFLSDWDFVVVEDEALRTLSPVEPAGRWN